MVSLVAAMKARLWQRFGTLEHPAEWDGHVYGGGKISQRFWEYFKSIEYLSLSPGDRLLDIGGGSPETGVSFFPQLVASFPELTVGVLDTHFAGASGLPDNINMIHGVADRSKLSEVIKAYNPTHISCLSVLEHAKPSEQKGIFEAIEADFHGVCIAMTFEFHEVIPFTNNHDADDGHRFNVTTTQSLDAMVSSLHRYYLSDFESTPILSVNAFNELGQLWRPLALRFLKID